MKSKAKNKKNLLIKHLLEKQGELKSQQKESSVIGLLGGMSDEEICLVMRKAMMKFVVYVHKDTKIVSWRSNSQEVREDKSIDIVDYVDTLKEALDLVRWYPLKDGLWLLKDSSD